MIAVGPGALNRDGKLIAMNVKVGDKVMLPEYGGHNVKLTEAKDEEYTLYREEDILGTLEHK